MFAYICYQTPSGDTYALEGTNKLTTSDGHNRYGSASALDRVVLACSRPFANVQTNGLQNVSSLKLPEALGCDGWFTARVTTCGELDQAIATAEARGTGAYIEVVTNRYAASPLAKKIHESVESFYA